MFFQILPNARPFFPAAGMRGLIKRRYFRPGFIFLMFFFLESMAAPPLKPAGVVNDFAGRLSSGETAALDQLSRCIYKSLECAIVVAILPSLDNGDIDQTANELYNRWGIGSRGSSNGALICLAIRDRKIRIETGYGAEGFLPDAIARRIIAAYQPLLTQGKFGAALLGMMAAIGQVAAGDKGIPLDSACFSAPMTATVIAPPQIAPLPHPRLFFLALVLLILFLLGTPAGRAMLPWILLMIFSGGGRNGGGGFGGGFGGGGFGGFGGGSSGGGGASGRF